MEVRGCLIQFFSLSGVVSFNVSYCVVFVVFVFVFRTRLVPRTAARMLL